MIFSPNKPKNGGITAGIARAGTGKDSATGNGVDDSDEVRPPGFTQMLFLVLHVYHVTYWLQLSAIWICKIYYCCFSSGASVLLCSCFFTPLLAFAILAAHEPSFSIDKTP
jgi:hypothetical protein